MAKTEETLHLEDCIYSATKKQGVFCCFEVTIGWWGKERVDYLTYDTKGVWRCYEIKVSLSDFHSKAAKTFVGHFNYFVLTRELYDKVQAQIPDGIGVYVGGECVRRAKRKPLAVDENILFKSMVRSLYREFQAHRASQDQDYMKRLKQTAEREQSERQRADRRLAEVSCAIREVFGQDAMHRVRMYLNDSVAVDANAAK